MTVRLYACGHTVGTPERVTAPCLTCAPPRGTMAPRGDGTIATMQARTDAFCASGKSMSEWLDEQERADKQERARINHA